MTSRRSFIIALAAASLSAPAFGQGYPNKPIRLVVPYAAGGVSDIMPSAFIRGMSAAFMNSRSCGSSSRRSVWGEGTRTSSWNSVHVRVLERCCERRAAGGLELMSY